MGTASSKFKKYLQHGDEFAAMQVCFSYSYIYCNLFTTYRNLFLFIVFPVLDIFDLRMSILLSFRYFRAQEI